MPAIILTEQGTLSSYLKAISLGVTAYFEKNVGSRELLRIIAETFDGATDEDRGCPYKHARCETEIQTIKTAYDRGYTELIKS